MACHARRGVVARAVVDDHDLVRGQGLGVDAGECAFEQGAAVVGRDDDRDRRRGRRHGRRLVAAGRRAALGDRVSRWPRGTARQQRRGRIGGVGHARALVPAGRSLSRQTRARSAGLLARSRSPGRRYATCELPLAWASRLRTPGGAARTMESASPRVGLLDPFDHGSDFVRRHPHLDRPRGRGTRERVRFHLIGPTRAFLAAVSDSTSFAVVRRDGLEVLRVRLQMASSEVTLVRL
jgi:hypothetical protein